MLHFGKYNWMYFCGHRPNVLVWAFVLYGYKIFWTMMVFDIFSGMGGVFFILCRCDIYSLFFGGYGCTAYYTVRCFFDVDVCMRCMWIDVGDKLMCFYVGCDVFMRCMMLLTLCDEGCDIVMMRCMIVMMVLTCLLCKM